MIRIVSTIAALTSLLFFTAQAVEFHAIASDLKFAASAGAAATSALIVMSQLYSAGADLWSQLAWSLRR